MKPIELVPQALQSVISALPAQVMQDLQMKMAEFEAALLARDPMMKHHLESTHRVLITYPETVHLLDNTEIAKLLDGAQELMKIQIVQNAAKGKGASKKKVGVEDL